MSKKNNSSRKEFAKSQFSLGRWLVEQKRYLEAEQAFQKITREDDKQLFAQSRLNLGILLGVQEKYPEAEHAYKEIKREDDKQVFAQSRLNLGILLGVQEKYPEAEHAYKEIKREDDKQLFAESRLNLGLLLAIQDKYPEAEQVFQKIKREDDKQLFAHSLVKLGLLLAIQDKYPEAEQVFQKIKREDDKQAFALSRIHLGRLLWEQKKYSEAKQVFQEIKREDDKRLFAQSQLTLGMLLNKQGKYSEAKQAYQKIKREDDTQVFVQSRNNLGILLYTQGKYDKAKKVFREVTRDDNPKEFAFTCINFGILLKENNELVEAKEVLKNINKDDGEHFFCKARLIIGEIFLYQGEYDNAKKFFEESKEVYHYESECFIRISQDSMEPFTKDLIKLKEIVDKILNCLKLDSEYEEYICHYTRPSTAFSLLGYNEKSSKLRLSTIKNVNDPTEGNILFDYFNLPNEEIGLCSFVSCFTFNHDSLNQFRLYGKENNQEASGVSLIFEKNFFGEYSEPCNFIEYGKKESLINSFSLENNSSINTDINNKINKLPVYRCIYMDNASGYIKLAKRSEIDFYREGRAEFFTSYLDEVNKKTNKVKIAIEEFKEVLNSMFGNDKYNEGLYNVVNYILLPLKFLIKHDAFEDEQECRIFFITNLFDERIISNVKEKSMYLEYEPSVREHIKEIYLSIGAYQYEDFFIRCLRDSSKVCRSRNPFRNK